MTSSVLVAAMAILISPSLAREATSAASSQSGKAQATSSASSSAPVKPLAAPQCVTAEHDDEVTITCAYTSTPRSSSNGKGQRIVLNRAVLVFKTHDENIMRVELTLTNEDEISVSEARPVYLAIDDDAGRNYVRRLLRNVDFRELTPGKRVTFSDRLRIGRFLAGHYTHLWIPSRDSSLQFNPADNLLISSAGVPDPQTGLNTLAAFTVER